MHNYSCGDRRINQHFKGNALALRVSRCTTAQFEFVRYPTGNVNGGSFYLWLVKIGQFFCTLILFFVVSFSNNIFSPCSIHVAISLGLFIFRFSLFLVQEFCFFCFVLFFLVYNLPPPPPHSKIKLLSSRNIVSLLQFASRAKTIKNCPEVNEV